MKKKIDNVIEVPCGGETVKFTSCLVSMLMRAKGIVDEEQDFYCNGQNGPCIRCGKCEDLVPLKRLHNEIYNLFTIVSGYGFLQIDLSDDEHMKESWDYTSQLLLREFDDYFDFTMNFAGYDYEKLQTSTGRQVIFNRIKESIDENVPVLVQLKRKLQWILVTGYDEDKILGLDGSQSYWGMSPAEPDSYENGLFIMSGWYEKLSSVYILGEKKEPTKDIRDVMTRGKKIMQAMKNKKYYQNSVAYMRDESNFKNLSDERWLSIRDRVAKWIGHPIDIRAMTGSAMNPLKNDDAFSKNEAIALHKIHGLCWTVHDVLWIAWFAIGEYKGGDKLGWAKGLQNPVIRNTVADCMDFVCRHDDMMLSALKDAF